MTKVLFLQGIEDSNQVVMHTPSQKGEAKYGMHGSIDIFADLRNPALQKQVVVLGGVNAKVPTVAKPDIIFNCITDADRSSKALKLAMQVIRQHKVPVINRPMHVLKTRRDDVATALADIPDLVVPATIRIRPSSHQEILDALDSGPVHYPAIIRHVGTHGGATMLVLHSREDAALLQRIACDGSEYYLIHFVDFRAADTFYHKLRLVIVGNHVFPRHLIASTDWNVHAGARADLMLKQPELLAAEAQFIKNFPKEHLPKLAERIKAIQGKLKLDYFSIDCAWLENGDLLIFEANASGNALRQQNLDKLPHLRAPVTQLRAAVTQMLLKTT